MNNYMTEETDALIVKLMNAGSVKHVIDACRSEKIPIVFCEDKNKKGFSKEIILDMSPQKPQDIIRYVIIHNEIN